MNHRRNLVVSALAAAVGISNCAGACDTGATREPEQPDSQDVLFQPTCGDVGTFVAVSVTSRSGNVARNLGEKITFNGAAPATGQRAYDAQDKRWTLGVNVPAGSTTGAVVASFSDPAVTPFTLGTFTIPCPPDAGPPDGSVDASLPDVKGPTCGIALAGAVADVPNEVYFGTAAIVPPGASSALLDAIADANVTPVPVGTCGVAPNPPRPTDAVDLGATISILADSTKLFDMSKIANNFYNGRGGVPPVAYDKPLSLDMPAATTVTPKYASAWRMPPELTVSQNDPAKGAIVVTRGQDLPFKFIAAPPTTSIYVRFQPGNKVCVFSAASGVGTVPGSFTQTLDSGGVDIISVATSKSQLEVGGTPCALRSVNLAIKGGPVTVQN